MRSLKFWTSCNMEGCEHMSYNLNSWYPPPRIVPHITYYMTPFRKFRLWLTWRVMSILGPYHPCKGIGGYMGLIRESACRFTSKEVRPQGPSTIWDQTVVWVSLFRYTEHAEQHPSFPIQFQVFWPILS